jgi:hypothetical protein
MRALPLLALSAWSVAACPAAPSAPATGVAAGSYSNEEVRLWVVHAGMDPSTLILEGPIAPPGTRVSILDAAGFAGTAEIVDEPAPECDDCPSNRRLARTFSIDRVLAEPSIAVLPEVGAAALLEVHPPPVVNEPRMGIQPWVTLDADGDGAKDVTVILYCGEFVPSGCTDRVCSQVCRAVVDPHGARIGVPECESFIPDLEDCLPFAEGCQPDSDRCRNVALDPPEAAHWARFASEGVWMEFPLEELRRLSAEMGVPALVTFLDRRPPEEEPAELNQAVDEVPGGQVLEVFAELLERGMARVIDPGSEVPVEYLVKEIWEGGWDCYQRGRQWRLTGEGGVFFHVTDVSDCGAHE